MSAVATTKLSSKGQVVIPEDVRKELGLEPGAQFVVMGEGDVVILKRIEARSPRIFDPRQTGAKSCDSDRNGPSLSIRLSPKAA
jgi:AbrB family looped-hinge helix DNA binding protein